MINSNNIFLVGPMGAGKSTIGKQLAARLHKSFLDADKEIEQHTGATVDLIFEIEGEQGFRKREAEIVAELTARDNVVLATGGGAILREDNRNCLTQRGTVIYLSAPPELLYKRTASDKKRPLLQTEDRLGQLTKILEEREPLYTEVADLIIDTSKQTVKQIVSYICKSLGTDA